MAYSMLYPDEELDGAKRKSSIDQFQNFLSVYEKGGWAPIVFEQLDGIGKCSGIKSHPVIISLSDDIGYIFPEAHCSYTSDKFIHFDKEAVEQKPLPSCFGGRGEWYQEYVRKDTFINFDGADGGSSVGTHNQTTLRVGLDYVKADETLPPVE